VNHDLETEWKFILAFEIALFLNLARLSILEEKLYKTQQYIITSGLMGLLVFNILILKVHGLSDRSISITEVHYPKFYFILNICYILILLFHPKNSES
jgi:hypothetical protein